MYECVCVCVCANAYDARQEDSSHTGAMCIYTCHLCKYTYLVYIRKYTRHICNIHTIYTYANTHAIYANIHTIYTYTHTPSKRPRSIHDHARSMQTFMPYIHTYTHTPSKRPRSASQPCASTVQSQEDSRAGRSLKAGGGSGVKSTSPPPSPHAPSPPHADAKHGTPGEGGGSHPPSTS